MRTDRAVQAATADLVAVLGPTLGVPVLSGERVASPYRSSHPLELVTVTLADNRRARLIFKDLSPAALSSAARAARAEADAPAWRELDMYREVLSHVAGAAPVRLGEHRDDTAGRYWLFLEPIDGAGLDTVGDLDVWTGAVGGLARLHGELARAPRPASLARYDERFVARWPARAVSSARGEDRDVLRCIAERYGEVLERLRAWPPGVVHGDLYPSNVMVRSAASGRGGVVVLDWESAGVGWPLLDVASLTAGSWTLEDRNRMALAYRDALPAARRPDREPFLADLDGCRLHVALQWLGWSRAWSPPPHHRHDWMWEARTAAERLKLL